MWFDCLILTLIWPAVGWDLGYNRLGTIRGRLLKCFLAWYLHLTSWHVHLLQKIGLFLGRGSRVVGHSHHQAHHLHLAGRLLGCACSRCKIEPFHNWCSID